MKRILEIRSYSLRPNARAEFIRLFYQEALPMLERWKVDVVAFGQSLEREEGAYLIRAYDSLIQREQSQEAFYGSPEWREGPREGLVSKIESYVDTVLELSSEAINALRDPNLPQH